MAPQCVSGQCLKLKLLFVFTAAISRFINRILFMFERRIRVKLLVKFEGHGKINIFFTVYIDMRV